MALADLGRGRMPDDLVLSGFRNKIINGDFDIWQRGTSQTATGYLSADRWAINYGTGTGSFERKAFTPGQTAVPGNPLNYGRHTQLTSASAVVLGALVNNIEGVETLAGREATLTYWARAQSPQLLTLRLSQDFGLGGSETVTTVLADISVTSSWEKYTISFEVPSIVGKTIGSANSRFRIQLGRDGSTLGYVDYSRVSLVYGDATHEDDPFSPRHYQQEFDLCQRYYQKSYEHDTPPGTASTAGAVEMIWGAASATLIRVPVRLPVVMRIPPSVTLYDADGNSGRAYRGGTNKVADATRIGQSGFTANCADTTSTSQFMFNYTADAEL